MRPLRLQMEGLRSYRHLQEIDLDKRGLVAIVGDTGAGKSSILEGIVYALYNATTWDQRGVKALMSDGVRKVAVVLDFSADGKEWRVTRSTGTQAVHELRCISHPDDPMGRVDGEAAVNASIEKLVGLNYEAFRSAVVLPQGRFQQLLISSPRDRTAILKGILRVDELEFVRNLANGAIGRVRPALAECVEERATYFPDPATRAAAAATERGRWDGQVAALTATGDQVDAHERAVTAAKAEATRLDSARAALAAAISGQSAVLRDLATVEAEIAGLLVVEDGRVTEAVAKESAASSVLDQATAAGAGLAEVGALLGTVERLAGDVPLLGERRNQVSALRARWVDAEAKAAADPARIATMEEAERAAGAEVTRCSAELSRAETALAAAEALLARYRQGVADADAAAAAAVSAVEGSQAAASRLEDSRAQVVAARATTAAAHHALEQVQRHNAAAHAAQGAAPGDPCPVCVRPLPKGFCAPALSGEDDARRAHASALATCSAAEREEAVAEAAAQLAATTVADTTERERDAMARRDALAAEAVAATGAADLTADDAVLLAALRDAVSTATAAGVTADRVRMAAGNELAVGRNEVEQRERDVVAAQVSVRAAETETGAMAARMDADLASIPEAHRPALPLSAEGCGAARGALAARAAELQGVEATRKAAAAERNGAERARDALVERRRAEVEIPATATVQPLAALHHQLSQAAADADIAAPANQPRGPTTADRAAWARVLEESAAAMCDRLRTAADTARGREQEAAGLLQSALAAAGFGTTSELADARKTAEEERFAAAKSEDEARQQVPLAAALDARIRPAQQLVVELEELAGLLSDAKFIRFVVDSKQQALLGVASEIFGDMTGAHYGFADDMQVIDRLSGQPRDAKTLSGGETFLASLALALGLVEIAGRSGGRLEALFLDEGFGSLDSDSLDEALTALEHVTGGDRMVAVISHLKAVAERIEDVLYVKRDPIDRSSEALWIGTTEKDALVEEEMEQGLLT